jgi:hypothetical protein
MFLEPRFFRPLGVLSIFAADPMIEAGVAAATSFLQEGDSFRLIVSTVSILSAVLLLVAGVLLCFKLVAGRTLAYVSASVSIPVTVFSAAIGLMGGHALMYGAGYPIVIVLLLNRSTPPSGIPTNERHSTLRADTSHDDMTWRTATA